jgi:hypothetical protein
LTDLSEKVSYKFPIFFFSVCFLITLAISFLGYTFPFYIVFTIPFYIFFGIYQGSNFYYIYFINYNSILFYYFLGCLSWSIVLRYYSKLNSENFRIRIKSIALFYPFWLGISIFLGSIGLSSYTNAWLIFHIFLYIWVGIGILYALNMILGIFKPRIHEPIDKYSVNRNNSENQIKTRNNKMGSLRFIDFFEKYEFKILTLIILGLGFYLVLSTIIEFLVFNQTSLFYLFFTLLIIILLIDINYLIFKED